MKSDFEKRDKTFLSPKRILELEINHIVDEWRKCLSLEKTWIEGLHVADILDKHIFPQIQERLKIADDLEEIRDSRGMM